MTLLGMGMLLACLLSIGARAAGSPCTASVTDRIPLRSAQAATGSEFGAQIQGMDGAERERKISEAVGAGDIPEFLRRFVPVQIDVARGGAGAVHLVLCVAPDYLAVGSNQDYLIVPVQLATALRLARRFDLSLPTPRIVDAIYAQAPVHLAPQPLPASDAMRSSAYFLQHNALIALQRDALRVVPGLLSAGDMKDLVLTDRLWQQPDRVAIYGWHRLDGHPIQPLSTVHGWRYVDYSHGVRLISTHVWQDGQERTLSAVLEDPKLRDRLTPAGALHDPSDLISELMQPRQGSPD